MLTIMVVEDDEAIRFALQRFFIKKQVQAICCASLEQARSALTPAISLVLLDLNLPDGSGYDFCRIVKTIGDIPVIFLTVRDEEKDIIKGLDMGADDYIVKPFQLSVLWSRINAVLRRTSSGTGSAKLLCCGEIRLDTGANRVWVSAQEVNLTAAEYRLLLLLLENKNRTMTRTALLEQLWDMGGEFVEDNTLTVTMKRLREKLGNPSCIRTLRGLGYRMEDKL